jgi:hypothetical protein
MWSGCQPLGGLGDLAVIEGGNQVVGDYEGPTAFLGLEFAEHQSAPGAALELLADGHGGRCGLEIKVAPRQSGHFLEA